MAKMKFTTLEDWGEAYISGWYPAVYTGSGCTVSVFNSCISAIENQEKALIRGLEIKKLHSRVGMITTDWVTLKIGTFVQSERYVVHPLVAKLMLAYAHSGKQPSPGAGRLFKALADKTGSRKEIKYA